MAGNCGYRMKLKLKLLALSCLLCLAVTDLWAQADPYGAVDTVSLGQVTVGAGKEFTINVNLFNDEQLGGVTIPLKYPVDKLEFKAVSFTGGRIDYVNVKPLTIDTINGTILAGAIVFMEAYIAPGNGLLFSLKFRLKDNVAADEIIVIDSTTISPAGLLLTQADASNIIPAFRRGEIHVASQNQPPVFAPVAEQYVAEGDSLILNLSVLDPNGDKVTIANPGHPFTAQFADNGDGTARFAWRPDYVGPLSSAMSPFDIVFWASDGAASRTLRVKVNVINVNRPPQIEAPALIQAEAGDSLGIAVKALDPDFEETQWQINGLPSGAGFDFENPGLISWKSAFADSGTYNLRLIATDPSGTADTAALQIRLAPVTLFSLRIDTLTTFPGKLVNLDVVLKNRFAIKEFRLLIKLDPSVVTPLSVTLEGTRADQFDYLEYRADYNGIQGELRIIGRAGFAASIPAGEGAVCRIIVQVASDLNYVGNVIPFRFVNHIQIDNSLIMSAGQVVTASLINLFDGWIYISSPGSILLGDINLNSIPYEISDAVYFTNFFISPGKYPMDERRVLNSDINRDGFAPSVADLVLLIKIITGEVPQAVGKPQSGRPEAIVKLARRADGLFIETDAAVGLAGLYVSLSGPDIDKIEAANLTGLDLSTAAHDGRFRGLLISYERETIPLGVATPLRLSNDPNLQVALEQVDAADAEGQSLLVQFKADEAALPRSCALHQNSPNPFNPTTQIEFDLAAPGRVTLAVYNILGQEVIRLTDGEFAAGHHQVTWNGRDRDGRPAASGVYLYRIAAGDFQASRKMVLMK